MTKASELLALAERVTSGSGLDNALDVLVEIALFEPDAEFLSVRANDAGTKVIYTLRDGTEGTFWAGEWTGDRTKTAAALRALWRDENLATGGLK